MTDRLVTPETALLAKDKGFDEYCEHVGAKVIKEHSRYHIEKLDYYEGREEVGKYRNAELPDEVEGYEFTVPTQSLLQRL